jgi:hypothetical protein
VPGKVLPLEAYADEVLANAKRAATTFQLIEREPLPSDPARGRFMHTVVSLSGTELEYCYGIVTAGDRGYQVIGFAEKGGFPSAEKELREIIGSFKVE